MFAKSLLGSMAVLALAWASMGVANGQRLSVAGSYPTQASLIAGRNTCGKVTVQDTLTTVEHTPGTHDLVLSHAGNRYPGTVDDGGRFSTAEKTLTFGDSRYTIVISGRFSRTGLTAEVQIHVEQPGPPASCSYAVAWTATKEGGPNTGLTDSKAHQ